MADHGSVGRLGAVAELLFLHKLPPAPRTVVALILAAACCTLGAYSLDIQAHFATRGGADKLTALLGRGSTAATAWIGWAAAACFLGALLRLRRVAPEPPAGRAPVESLSAAQLRAGLVREYTVVRAGLVVLAAVALIDAARAGRYLVAAAGGHRLARASLTATVVEAAGLVVAAVILAAWALTFRRQLVRVGALGG